MLLENLLHTGVDLETIVSLANEVLSILSDNCIDSCVVKSWESDILGGKHMQTCCSTVSLEHLLHMHEDLESMSSISESDDFLLLRFRQFLRAEPELLRPHRLVLVAVVGERHDDVTLVDQLRKYSLELYLYCAISIKLQLSHEV